MLRSMNGLEDYAIHATDGAIGHVKDFYFDDEAWVIRYLIVDTGEISQGSVQSRWSEFAATTCFDRVELSAAVDGGIAASFKNGLLEIGAPKTRRPAESVKKADISAAC